MDLRILEGCALAALVGVLGCGGGQMVCRSSSDCFPDEICLATNLCGPAAPAPVADAGPVGCGGELFNATKVQANFLIVLDRSASMEEQTGTGSKWWAASSAVKSVTTQNDQAIRFGLELYPGVSGTTRCQLGSVAVPIGDQSAAAISGVLPVEATGNSTPIGSALTVASAAPELTDPTRANYVLLVTDGKENCNGNPVGVVKSMFNRGIKTYVVGFGAQVDAAMLTSMANSGGTARSGTTKYYQADDPASLNSAMSAIAAGAMGCDFKLAKAPPDPKLVFVYVNGQLATRDPARANGWEYTPATQRITLYGAACDAVSHDAAAKVSIVYGCPDDTLVEGNNNHPRDGGTMAGSSDGGTAPPWIN